MSARSKNSLHEYVISFSVQCRMGRREEQELVRQTQLFFFRDP